MNEKKPTTYHSAIKRLVYKLLKSCLTWIREEELGEEEMVIVIRAKHAPTVLKNQQSMIWQAGFCENREIKVSEWVDFETSHLMRYRQLKKLFQKYLPECEVQIAYREGVKVLEILWPTYLSYQVVKDLELASKKQKVSITHGILTLLTYHPEWMSIGQNKKGEVFRRKVPMGFEKQRLVIYEGDEGSYIFNEKGLIHFHSEEIETLLKSKEYRTYIPHHKGYEHWQKEINEIFNNKEDGDTYNSKE